MIKAPVFAFVLAIVACRQGLMVGGDVGSLGKRTTASVVQAIFLIILLDAIFALWFLELDI
jgi:phospholipid/cholesterol/gamma-HCH transport system permease protein